MGVSGFPVNLSGGERFTPGIKPLAPPFTSYGR